MAEINQELLDKIKAEAEQKKAEKAAKKELRKAKRKMFVQEHKLLLTGIGVGTALTVSKIVKDVLADMNGKKAASEPVDTSGAYRDGYRDGWCDYDAQVPHDDGAPVETTTEDAPVE